MGESGSQEQKDYLKTSVGKLYLFVTNNLKKYFFYNKGVFIERKIDGAIL